MSWKAELKVRDVWFIGDKKFDTSEEATTFAKETYAAWPPTIDWRISEVKEIEGKANDSPGV